MDWLQSQRDKLYNNTDKSDVLALLMALQLHQARFIFNSSIILLFKFNFWFFLIQIFHSIVISLKLFLKANWTRLTQRQGISSGTILQSLPFLQVQTR